MEQQQPAERNKQKYLKLDEEAWNQVRIFVANFFQQPEKAAKATYDVLFREINQQYPHIVLEKKTFARRVASIEKLKADAGIHTHNEDLSKEYREQLNNIFPQVLIGLPVQEFESINFEALIQRAHTL